MRRSIATLSTLALAATALATGGSGTAQAESPALVNVSPIQLWAPSRVVAYSYGGAVYDDLGLRLIAPTEPFELWSNRPTYDDPIHTEWRSSGGPVPLPEGTMTDFSGLPDFLSVEVRRVSDGELVQSLTSTVCLNGQSERTRPDAPARTPYPWGCPSMPYTVGSVMGIQAGWATNVFAEYDAPLMLKPGKYDLTATITPTYASTFGIEPADTTRELRLVVKASDGRLRPAARPAARPDGTSPVSTQPAAHEPARLFAGLVAEPKPDLRALPAFGIQLNGKGTALRFGANVWNGGNSPLVVDGFRVEGQDYMDAYQYFFDTDGNQTGYQAVGQLHYHAGNHNHWHFEDFARYQLLNADLSVAVKSRKQSFCLANTDAVDYTVDGADWHPESTDLSTACGGPGALSIREVLSSGSGDSYFQYRYGQAFKLDGLPNGIYYISVEANPLGNLIESDTTNNNSLRKVRLGGTPEKRWVKAFQVGIVEESYGGGSFRPFIG